MSKENHPKAPAEQPSTRQRDRHGPAVASTPSQEDPMSISSDRHSRASPYDVGRNDLDPFAGHHRDPNSNSRDGMIVGPGHPMFSAPHPEASPLPRVPDSYLPPGAVPPGAYFDPITPFGPYPDPLSSSSSNPQRRLHPSGEPDQDELLPPGHVMPSGTFPSQGKFNPPSFPGNFGPRSF